MRIPETAFYKYQDNHPQSHINNLNPEEIPRKYKIPELVRLLGDQDELAEIDLQLEELKERRREVKRSVNIGLQKVAGLPRAERRRRNR